MTKGTKGIDPEAFWDALQTKQDRIEQAEQRFDAEFTDDAELLVVAFGTLARFARYVVRALRAEGVRVGYFRPISLWPFPSAALARASEGVTRVACLEQNAGQMVEDVRLAVLGRAPVVSIGGISTDAAGFGIGPLMDAELIRQRIEITLAGGSVPRGVVRGVVGAAAAQPGGAA
jgi:2-oxoglutarate ferredoxin oxidoreductase subunit alpha